MTCEINDEREVLIIVGLKTRIMGDDSLSLMVKDSFSLPNRKQV